MKRHVFSAATFSGALLGAAMFASPAMAQEEEQFITIGTGGQTGVYYVVGQSVCRLVNRLEDANIKCNAPSTGGSVANINGIRSGELNMGSPSPTSSIRPTMAPATSRAMPIRTCARCSVSMASR
ncbi:hypothetical protein A8U91_03499 [Halomonas elongata]|uniref:NMT1/THI5 like protein n=1 Tax=Halomonas elongata TaxID=2746 RepID=A0A1B8NWQ3_HALEL|nr:hypothetical protein A8U91_03499 [Halomonas elongata]